MRWLVLVWMLAACSDNAPTGNQFCDDSFAALTVAVTNASGPVVGLAHHTTLDSTMIAVSSDFDGDGTYTVFDDGSLSLVKDDPEQIEITFAKDANMLVVAGTAGTDAHGCHVEWAADPSPVTWPY